MLRFDAVGGGHRGVGVGTIVVACFHDADVGLCHGRFLGKLLMEELLHQADLAVEEPAHQSEGEHVAALQDGLVVHAAILQAILHHCGDGASHHVVGVDLHLAQVVVACELRLLQVGGTKGVGVDDDGCQRFGVAVLSLERRCVHGYEHVTLVAWRVNLSFTDMHLVTRYARE